MDIDILKVFSYYKDKSEYIRRLSISEYTLFFIIKLSSLIISLLFIYGFIIGINHGFAQAISAGIKLPFLFVLSIVISFPTFYVIQIILGSRIKLSNLIAMILSGTLLSCWIMIAFIPIVIFFMITGGDYYFMQLLHISILAFSSFFGMKLILEALEYSCETENIYPKTGVTIFRLAIIIFLFVSIQLGWNLRPFMSKKEEPFQITRHYEGNFYTAILYSFDKILNPQKDN